MTPELRAAAERLIETIDERLQRWRNWFPSDESIVDVPRSDLLAVAECARQFLAEHPPDDDEPVTEAFLVSVGFTYDDEIEAIYIFLPEIDGKTLPLVSQGSDYWMVGLLKILAPQSRGDVRRLLAALGLNPNKETNESTE